MLSRSNLPVKIVGFKGNCPRYVYFLSYYDVLLRVLKKCDAAIKEAARLPVSKVRGEIEQNIKMAARELDTYGKEFHRPK